MAFLSVIRRWALRDQLSIREISRRTGLSRSEARAATGPRPRRAIRKYPRAGTVDPPFQVPERPSKLDPYAEKLAAWLKTEAGKPRKQRRTPKQLHAELASLGYEGSHNRVAAFARRWKEARQRESQSAGRGTFVPLAFEPGEAFQFDWSEAMTQEIGRRSAASTRSFRWRISSWRTAALPSPLGPVARRWQLLVRVHLLQTHEILFDAHWHGFVRGILGPVADCPSPSEASRDGGFATAFVDPPLVRGVADEAPSVRSRRRRTRRRRWTGWARARRGRSTPASRAWQATTSSSRNSAIRRLAGSGALCAIGSSSCQRLRHRSERRW